jgi:predicted metal-dependent hydrolase
MATLVDPDFGEITIRRSPLARAISVRVAPNGRLRANLPPYAGLSALKRMINASRSDIAKLLDSQNSHTPLTDGMTIGKSHTLLVSDGSLLTATLTKSHVRLTLPPSVVLDDPLIDGTLTPIIIKALRQEAKAYLPRRLQYLASAHGFSYEQVRFSHASSRWGSCSSRGTISLNIALMKLPFELIDYVLIHELSHLDYMNHSPEFWQLVGRLDPDYRDHRRVLKTHNPSAYI